MKKGLNSGNILSKTFVIFTNIKERSLKARVFQALTFEKLAEESKEQTKETDTPQEG